MRCDECKEKLVDYIEGLLPDQEAQQLKSHLGQCSQCRTELDQLTALGQRLTSDAKNRQSADVENRVVNRIICEQNKQLKEAAVKKRQPQLWRIIMKAKITKLAAAAVILIGVSLLFLFNSGSSGVVWADVVQRVQQVKSFGYQMQMQMSGEAMAGTAASPMTNMDFLVWMTADNRIKMEMSANGKPGSTTYLLPEQQKMIMVMPEMKQYMEMELNDESLSKMKQQSMDPKELVQQMIHARHQSIGKTTLDGVEVEGLETTDPAIANDVAEKVLARLWVDVKTGYPVQMDVNMDTNDGKTHIHYTIRNFQWSQDVDDAIFMPQIGKDYTAMPKMQMPKMDEQAAVEGLKKYTELTGKYPDSLNLMELSTGLQKAMQNNKAFDPNQYKGLSKDDIMKKTMEITMPLQAMGAFYMTLVQGKKDPAYYGATVAPGDAQQVLLRWKTSDATYKVIMGDLSTTEVSAEQLKQIEPAVQNPPQTQ